MSVGILLITHNRLGDELLDTARATLGFCPMQTRVLAVREDADPIELTRQAMQWVHQLDSGDGVLVLTDAFGSTPSNIAARLARDQQITVVAGVNLPMLLRIFNYAGLTLSALAHKAVSGGRDGVLLIETDRASREV